MLDGEETTPFGTVLGGTAGDTMEPLDIPPGVEGRATAEPLI
jgi:hypothetical protein